MICRNLPNEKMLRSSLLANARFESNHEYPEWNRLPDESR